MFRTSLFGRSKITLSKYNKDPIPTHSLKVSDEVCFYSQKQVNTKDAELEKMNGIVTKCGSNFIEIIFDTDLGEVVEPIRVDLRVNETTHNKLMDALTDMAAVNENSKLINLLFHQFHAPPAIITNLLGTALQYPPVKAANAYTDASSSNSSNALVFKTPHNRSLNPSQVDAIQYALQAPHLALIHGPVGLCLQHMLKYNDICSIARHW